MWWHEFERQLSAAFIACNNKENKVIYSNEMRLRILIKKVSSDLLSNTKDSIGIELTIPVVTMSYKQALSSFRNEANRNFLPDLGGRNNTRRTI